jgi:hypothetical protein
MPKYVEVSNFTLNEFAYLDVVYIQALMCDPKTVRTFTIRNAT